MQYNSAHLPLAKRSAHPMSCLYSLGYEPVTESNFLRNPFAAPGYNPSRVPKSSLRLLDAEFQCERNLGWSIEYATAYVLNHLDPANNPAFPEEFPKYRVAARRSAQNKADATAIAVEAFRFIDKHVFNNNLKNAVYLDCQSLGHEVSGATYNPNQGLDPRVRRVSIVLNRDFCEYHSTDTVIASLIHQMIHAYFLIACGPQQVDEVDYGRLGHGLPFQTIISNISRRSHPDPHQRMGLNPAHNPNPVKGMVNLFDSLPLRMDSHCPGKSKSDDWFCSYCSADITAIRPLELKAWYMDTCRPLLTLPECTQKAIVHIFKNNELIELPRAKSISSLDSVEFIFAETLCVQVPRERINMYPSVAAAFAPSRWLAIPEDTTKDTFVSFLEFLHTGTYAPDLSPVTSSHRKGPPLILPVRSDSLPYLLTDIRLFKLASALKMDDIKGAALARLKSQIVTHEDPISILKQIYPPNSPDPDPALRTWTIKFLSQHPGHGRGSSTPSTLEDELFGTETASAGGSGAMMWNLAKLEKDFGFRPRFLETVEESSALQIDVLRTRERIQAQAPSPNTPGALAIAAAHAVSQGPSPSSTPGPFALSHPHLYQGGLHHSHPHPSISVAGLPSHLMGSEHPLMSAAAAGKVLQDYERLTHAAALAKAAQAGRVDAGMGLGLAWEDLQGFY